MKSNRFIPIWEEGMRIIREGLESNQDSSNQSRKRDGLMSTIGEYETQADHLETCMVDAARRGLFNPEFLSPIQERWMRLDETVELYYDSCNQNRNVYDDDPLMFRSSLTWLVADPELR
jgi:hypothetical protein